MTFRSLQGKFTFYLAILVMALTAFIGYQDIRRERHLLEDRISGQGRALVETLAIPVTNTLLYQELELVEEGGLLDNYVEQLMAEKSLGIVYAEILDTGGKVIAHSDTSQLGAVRRHADDLEVLSSLQTRLGRTRSTHQGRVIPVLDISTPLAISSKRWGTLRVGISLAPLKERLLTASLRIVLLSLASMAFVVVAVALLFRALTKPIRQLSLMMDRIAAGGSLDLSPDSSRNDEIGVLQRSFASMVRKLREADQERELTQKRFTFAEKMASIGKLTAAISHEINNPLGGLLNCVHAFKKKSLPEPKKKEYLSLMEDGILRIQKRVKNLLEYARPHELKLVPSSINTVVDKVLGFLDFSMKKAGISVEKDLEKQLPNDVLIDPNQIEQVLVNVFLNALQAMENGGLLTVQTAYLNGVCRIEISDTGPGIPADIQPKVLDLFFTTKGSQGGTGLGLPVSQRIVESHGGTLRMVSREANGTTVMIELPLTGPKNHMAEKGFPIEKGI